MPIHPRRGGLAGRLATAAALGVVAGSARAQGIDAAIDGFFNDYLGWFARLIFTAVPLGGTAFPLIAGWLLVAALVFTLYFGFLQLRRFKLATDIVRGRYDDPKRSHDGEISHFRALATALSGTVGLGNIAGVGAALAIGGPGATFWMIVVGLLGMASKFTECTLGVKYRTILPSGVVSGGPMYYLSRGLAERGLGGLGRVLAVMFSIMVILARSAAATCSRATRPTRCWSRPSACPTATAGSPGWCWRRSSSWSSSAACRRSRR